MNKLKQYLEDSRQMVDKELDRLLPKPVGLEESVCDAMRYSVFAGGKRIRPILLLAANKLCEGDSKQALPAACALEMVHTYSLIHDDLPAIDNGQLRRGKPTTHKKFNEAVAILAGDALLTLAFETLARCPEAFVAQLVYELATAAGTTGMIGGQVADIEWTGRGMEYPTLEFIHSHKTGALITAAIRMGAILAKADETALKSLTGYGRCLGLAFQIADDILDVESSSALTGKDSGADAALGKATYPRLFGVSESRQRCLGLIDQAKKHLADFGARADLLEGIADMVGNRTA
ncbi:MAG: polyprenyl synthetase family protein [Candidatus Abyssobacteria bacterium SURF_17]|uniref:Polyprenyl synthetase family protein n=1 Tax=Candidatus Abyssobacteria bacterium SURF_17 TaxID=2093361 RepID=A0A419F558_9BACT|nr:MAG: polyprenyl synthetase family protein [Candidatus Abyssubacteria bacterium SURF_17]